MLIALRHGRATAVDDPDVSWSLSAPIDDLMGLMPDPNYVAHLARRYGPLLEPDFRKRQRALRGGDKGPSPAYDPGLRLADELLHKIRLDAGTTRRAFTVGAQEAEDGHLSRELAPFFALIQWIPGSGVLIAPEIEALGAWCLIEIVRSRRVMVVACENCGVPFVSLGRARYCSRPVPGSASLAVCRELASQRTHRTKHGDYQRERKRLHERKRRGLLTQSTYDDWSRENSPTDWKQFDEWANDRQAGNRRDGSTRADR